MDKTPLQDKRLSWKAKGIIAYMLSMPDDWTFYMTELINHSTDGEKSFRSGMKELKDCGYVQRIPVYENRKIVRWETIINENPSLALDTSVLAQNVQVQNVQVQNDVLLNNNNTKNNNTKNNIESVSPPQASPLTSEKKKRKIERIAFAHNVFLTQKKYDELCKMFGKQNVDRKIIAFSKYQDNPSKKFYEPSQHFRTLKNWLTMDGKPNEQFGKTKLQQEEEELERWIRENGHTAN